MASALCEQAGVHPSSPEGALLAALAAKKVQQALAAAPQFLAAQQPARCLCCTKPISVRGAEPQVCSNPVCRAAAHLPEARGAPPGAAAARSPRVTFADTARPGPAGIPSGHVVSACTACRAPVLAPVGAQKRGKSWYCAPCYVERRGIKGPPEAKEREEKEPPAPLAAGDLSRDPARAAGMSAAAALRECHSTHDFGDDEPGPPRPASPVDMQFGEDDLTSRSAGRRSGDGEDEAAEKPCPSLLAGNVCVWGDQCPFRHPDDLNNAPHAFATLDPPARPGDKYRFRNDRYGGNPEATHVRTLEPLPAAWGSWKVPRLRAAAYRSQAHAPARADHPLMNNDLALYVDLGDVVEVSLVDDVVYIARRMAIGRTHDVTLRTFHILTHMVERVCSPLRLTPKEIWRHVHYAALLAYYATDVQRDYARMIGLGYDLRWLVDLARFFERTVGPAGCLGVATGGAGFFAAGRAARRHASVVARFAAPKRLRVRFHSGAPVPSVAFVPPLRPIPLAAAAGSLSDALKEVGRELLSLLGCSKPASYWGSWFSQAKKSSWRSPTKSVLIDRASPPLSSVGDFAGPAITCFVGPILEESAKHACDAKGAPMWGVRFAALGSILFAEAASTALACLGRDEETIIDLVTMRMLTTGMHLATFAMPVGYAMPVHAAWNTFVAPALVRGANARNFARQTAGTTVTLIGPGAASGLAVGGALGALFAAVPAALSLHRKRRRRVAAAEAAIARAVELERQLAAEPDNERGVVIDESLLHPRGTMEPRPVVAYAGDRMVPKKPIKLKPGVKIKRTHEHAAEEDAAALVHLRFLSHHGPDAKAAPASPAQVELGKRAARVVAGAARAPEFRPNVAAHTRENIEAIVAFRTAVDTQLGDIKTLEDFALFIHRNYHRLFRFKNGARLRVSPLARAIFIARVGSSPEIKRLLELADAELTRLGITNYAEITPHLLKKIAGAHKVFEKAENLLHRTPYGVKDAAPRPIVPFNAMAMMILGPWLMAAQDALIKCWHLEHFITLHGKGVTAEDVGRTFAEAWARNWALGIDDTEKYDVSQDQRTYPVNEAQMLLYARMGAPPLFLQVYKAELKVRLKFKFGISVEKWMGQVCSGAYDTWLWNGVRNGLTHFYDFVRDNRLTLEQAMALWKAVVCGDDEMHAHPPELATDFQRDQAEHAFKSEAGYFPALDDPGYCSSRIFDSTDGPKLTPMVGRVLAKLGSIVDPPVGVPIVRVLRGVALGLEKSLNHVPPAKAVLAWILHKTAGVEPYYLRKHEYKGSAAKCSEATIKTWEQMAHHYGWHDEDQRALEKALACMELGDAYPADLVYKLLERDTDGPLPYPPHPATVGLTLPYKPRGPPLYGPGGRVRPGRPGDFGRHVELWMLDERGGWIRDLCAEGVEPNPGHGVAGELIGLGVVGAALLAAAAIPAARAFSSYAAPAVYTQVFFRFDGRTHVANIITRDGEICENDLFAEVLRYYGLRREDAWLSCCGATLVRGERTQIPENTNIEVNFRLRGGMGGSSKKKLRGILKATSSKKKKGHGGGGRRTPSRGPGPARRRGNTPGRRLAGRGDYFPSESKLAKHKGSGQSWGRHLGGAIGGALGHSGLGAEFGAVAHRLFRGITGRGDYGLGASSSTSAGENSMLMGTHYEPTVIAHTEFLGMVLSSTGLATTAYRIQPGLPQAFPWLSTVARNYTQYELIGCVFHYISTSGISVNANPALGTVMMATQYDAHDSPLPTLQAIKNHDFTTENKPSESFFHAIECDPKQQPISLRYVVTESTMRPNEDVRWLDQGLFQVSTQGQQSDGLSIGELWVHYRIRLEKPSMPPQVNEAFYWGRTGSVEWAYPTRTFQQIVPTNVDPGSNSLVTFSGNSVDILNPMPATYFVSVSLWSNNADGFAAVSAAGAVEAANFTVTAGARATVHVVEQTVGDFFYSTALSGLGWMRRIDMQAVIQINPVGISLPNALTRITIVPSQLTRTISSVSSRVRIVKMFSPALPTLSASATTKVAALEDELAQMRDEMRAWRERGDAANQQAFAAMRDRDHPAAAPGPPPQGEPVPFGESTSARPAVARRAASPERDLDWHMHGDDAVSDVFTPELLAEYRAWQRAELARGHADATHAHRPPRTAADERPP